MAAHLRGRYRALPIVASPLEQEELYGHHHAHSDHSSENENELKGGGHSGVAVVHDDQPVFREKEEASTIELFYDLFFVANLTSFTNVHAIDDRTTISSYIGFFAILWFTWLQVVLYDVRFGVDSLFERICKLIHFGVMVSFAVAGTKFDPTSVAENYATFRQLSLILIISRIVLIFQYGSILFWIKGHTRVMTPIVIQMATFAVGAFVSLGLLFTFKSTSSGRGYLGWYVVAALEALVVFLTSSHWRVISFKRTNINERCGLLTLIILGEGIIVLTKAMNSVVKGENFSAAIIAQIISAVLIIYFLYMLYFDQVDNKRFGTVRQQFWALCHFPFHIALVLLMEGTARFITWRNAIEVVDDVIAHFDELYNSSNDTVELANGFAAFSTGLLTVVEADPVKFNVTQYLYDLAGEPSWDTDAALLAVDDIIGTLINATFKFFKIQGSKKSQKAKDPSGDSDSTKDPFAELYNALKVYDLVFVYFFVAAGLTLVMMAILIALAKKGKCAGDYAAIVLRLVVGTGLAMVAIITTNQTAQQNYLNSPWMLPSVLLALFVVVLLDGIFGYVLPAPKTLSKTNSHESHHGHA